MDVVLKVSAIVDHLLPIHLKILLHLCERSLCTFGALGLLSYNISKVCNYMLEFQFSCQVPKPIWESVQFFLLSFRVEIIQKVTDDKPVELNFYLFLNLTH